MAGTTSAFPNQTYEAENYWVDVMFLPTITDGPVLTSKSPAADGMGVGITSAISVGFSEAVQAATIVFQLRDSGGSEVPSTVSYDAVTHFATLSPNAPLDWSSTYVVIVDGAQNSSGHVMAPVSWFFTTMAAIGNGPYSIWSSSAVPGTAEVPDTNAVELGVKFRSDVDGYITGIRFYKGVDNTGPHVGNLWTSSGTLLATATFTSESDTGWQQVTLSAPVAIAANTTYVASYHTDVGHYAADGGYFASSGVDNPPLHAMANGTGGGNGVYQYGATSTFPDQTYDSLNYWVDIVFVVNVMPGDANLDGVANIYDLSKVLANFDKTGLTLTWSDGDFDHNGTVDIADLSKVLTNYDQRIGVAAPETRRPRKTQGDSTGPSSGGLSVAGRPLNWPARAAALEGLPADHPWILGALLADADSLASQRHRSASKDLFSRTVDMALAHSRL
jgi:hypothetical protein